MNKEKFETPTQISEAFNELKKYILFLEDIAFSDGPKEFKLRDINPNTEYILGRPLKVTLEKKGDKYLAQIKEAPRILSSGDTAYETIQTLKRDMVFELKFYKHYKKTQGELSEQSQANLDFLKEVVIKKEHLKKNKKGE